MSMFHEIRDLAKVTQKVSTKTYTCQKKTLAKNSNLRMIVGERAMSDSNETGPYLMAEMQRYGARGASSSWRSLASGPIDVGDYMK
jgi:hypothetical protein